MVSSMPVRSTITSQIQQIAQEQSKMLVSLTDDLNLLESGLDSLCFAILVARLEDLMGFDPFTSSTESHYPVTLGDFISLYESAAK